MLVRITAIFFALIGTALTFGGIQLLSLSGSPYYIIAGFAFLGCAILLWRKSRAVLWLYAALIVATMIWGLWEVGSDWWPLASRGGVMVLLGIWLLLPWIRAHLVPKGQAWPLGTTVVAAILVAGYSMTQDLEDKKGTLPQAIANASPNFGGDVSDEDWPAYGRTHFGQRYSPLAQITTRNVGSLEQAWVYQTGDIKGPDDVAETTYQVTPLKIRDTLYVCTPHNWAIAIDAKTGKQKWKFNPQEGLQKDRQHQTCRGVTYWRDTARAEGSVCAERIFLPTANARLYALDMATGKPCEDFGRPQIANTQIADTQIADTQIGGAGWIDLMRGMPFKPAGYYYSTSPPVALKGLVILGGAVNDDYSTTEPSGVIRGFDAVTGRLVWNWDSARPDVTTPINISGGETYVANSPNSWSIFSADEALGLVYVPLGNKTPDQLGMGRSPAVEAHSSAVVALDIATGQKKWVFQTVHHDLWDRDLPAQPVLIDLDMPQGRIPSMVLPTKQGDVYVLDRRNGRPVLPVREIATPAKAIAEDFNSPSQPVSRLSFNPPALQEADMWGASPIDQMVCRIHYRGYKYQGRYTPPSLQGSIVYPGNTGVFNWGSVAVDPERQVMFGAPVHLAFIQQLVPAADLPPKDAKAKASELGINRNEGSPYGSFMGPFVSPLGVPCQKPGWGFVTGADLRTGEIAWQHRNGTIRDMSPVPVPLKLGVPSLGGPVITKGGVVFMAAAVDNYLRAYDLTTGQQLWQTRIPAGGQSTPMTYAVDGRQYVVIVAGGHGSLGTTPGDYVIAYRLP